MLGVVFEEAGGLADGVEAVGVLRYVHVVLAVVQAALDLEYGGLDAVLVGLEAEVGVLAFLEAVELSSTHKTVKASFWQVKNLTTVQGVPSALNSGTEHVGVAVPEGGYSLEVAERKRIGMSEISADALSVTAVRKII